MQNIKKIWNLIWDIYHKKEEVWNYLISGAFGFVISIVSYWLFRKIGLSLEISNVLSWIIAVISMYLTNKFFVFKTKCNTKKEVIKEFISFIAARIFTLIAETVILYLGFNFLHFNDIIVKIFAQIIVIILNYVFSKIFIFKKQKSHA